MCSNPEKGRHGTIWEVPHIDLFASHQTQIYYTPTHREGAILQSVQSMHLLQGTEAGSTRSQTCDRQTEQDRKCSGQTLW
jgi:hypothetical protein